TVYTFGSQSSSRQDNPSDSTQVFRWMLERSQDTNGNFISYTYSKDGGQIYPASIVYTCNGSSAGIFGVDFLLQAGPDQVRSYSTGFLVTTSSRATEIDVKTLGGIHREYSLTYAAGDNGPRSILHTITEIGIDEDTRTSVSLPATTFTNRTNSVST